MAISVEKKEAVGLRWQATCPSPYCEWSGKIYERAEHTDVIRVTGQDGREHIVLQPISAAQWEARDHRASTGHEATAQAVPS